MNTPAHLLLAAVFAAKPDASRRNTALLAGALVPDAMMFVMVGWERWVNGLSANQIFQEAYYSSFWQQIFAVTNSLPIFAGLLIWGLYARIEVVWAFGLAAVLHGIADLPLHHDDGHPHFWPFTGWIYESPVSYWDPAHHGQIAGVSEAVFCIGLAAILWSRFRGMATRVALAAVLGVELLFSVGASLIYGSGLL